VGNHDDGCHIAIEYLAAKYLYVATMSLWLAA